MRPITISRTLAAADADGIATSQTPLAGGPLTLDGAFAANGVATLDVQRQVSITAVGDESARTFTIIGTDQQGRIITETLAGPNAGAADSVLDYLTVTEVSVDAATAGAITVGTNESGASQPIPLDPYNAPMNTGLTVEINGTVNVTVEQTRDDVFSDPGPFTWFGVTGLENITADTSQAEPTPITAVRLVTNSGDGTAILRVVQAGISG